jgi:hypothetical protein
MTSANDRNQRRRVLWVSRSPGKLVARYVDGRILKGYAGDFDPDQPRFRLALAQSASDEAAEIQLSDLKAVFFVRSFEGDPAYAESRDLYQARPPGTRKIRVEFADGEVVVGYTTTRDSRRFGLFFSPLDPKSNNLRVFAVTVAVARVERLL